MNILLVDDHTLFAASLSAALEEYDEIQHFISAQDTENLEELILKNRIDIVLMDINLGKDSGPDGLEAAALLHTHLPDIKIVILTGYDLPVYRYEAKKNGLRGFLNKSIRPEALVKVLSDVYNGKTCFPAENVSAVPEELTAAEKKILSLLCSGKKRRDIAAELFISERTLSNHIQHIFEKLDVSSTVEAVTKAIQAGYIPPVM